MVKLLILCFFLVSCYTARYDCCYEVISEKKWKTILDENLDKYLDYYSEIDSLKDVFFLVYDLRYDAAYPDAFFFYYDGIDSVKICPLHIDAPYCEKYALGKDIFPVDAMEQSSFELPSELNEKAKWVFGCKKENGRKKYYSIYQMEMCNASPTYIGRNAPSVQKNAMQCELNSNIFNRFELLRYSLYGEKKLEEKFRKGELTEEEYDANAKKLHKMILDLNK